MSHFSDKKTEFEILLDEQMKKEEESIYNLNLEIEEDFIEIKIKESGEKNEHTIPPGEKLSSEFREWLSSRPKLLFSLLKQRRFKDSEKELRLIWKRLRQEYRARKCTIFKYF